MLKVLTLIYGLCFIPLIAINLNDYSVDFDQSMGKGDKYMNTCFENFMKALPTHQHGSFSFIQPHSPEALLKLCKDSYYLNRLCFVPFSPTYRIPRVFHQIWIGKPLPDKYKKWQQTWQSVPGWTYKLWTDKEIEELGLYNKNIYDKEENLGARSDIARIEILYRFGGVYVDIDFELLQPKVLNFLHKAYDFYCCITPLDCWSFFINNAIIGAIPGHPILKAYIDTLKVQDMKQMVVGKGPGFFTKMILLHAGKGYRDIIFPPTFFYPVGYKQAQDLLLTAINDPNAYERMKQDMIKPETIAVHWWEGSWTLPDATVKGVI